MSFRQPNPAVPETDSSASESKAPRARAATLRRPPLLTPGARVMLVAPAGRIDGPGDLERARANVRSFGWEPVVGASVLRREGYLAGTDDERLADVAGAIADPAIDAIWCLRGGYGSMRLLHAIDFAALRRRPKTLLGFSDITALHAAVQRHARLVTFHGPVARARLTPFTRDSLRRAIVEGADPCGTAPAARVLRPGCATGRLAGGNLALLASLAGSRYAPRLDGAILVIEDVHEAIYRIDRMLLQLRLAGLLRGCRALVAGAFTDTDERADGTTGRLDEVLAETAAALDVPCLAGVPIGHIDDQWTLPLGARATLDTSARRLSAAE